MTDIRARLEALAAQPRQWRTTLTYSNGTVKTHDSLHEQGAENFALGARLRMKRTMISRETGETVRIVSVTVSRI